MERAVVLERHMQHGRLREMVPYWRAKLDPATKLWAGEDGMAYDEGPVQGSPSSSAGFSYTIHGRVKEADARLAEYGGCVKLGIDDGCMVRPREVIFEVLSIIAKGIKEECGCALNVKKCKMYCEEAEACYEARSYGLIPGDFQHLQEEVSINKSGERLRGIRIFNVPMGQETYAEAILRQNAKNVEKVTERYAEDLGEEYPQELWIMLQYSLQH